jgi:sulfide:quinone oxidoreductase
MTTERETAGGRNVVVVGGSFAGLGAAYRLRERLRPTDRVTLVSQSERFTFAPSLIWAALGQPLLHSSFALEPALSAKGIEFIPSHVREVRVADHVVITDKEELPYHRLVVATGGRPDPNAVPGLAGEFRAASWIVGEDSAMEARNVIRDLYANPGPLVIGSARNASYYSAAYELALALDTALREKGIRDRVPMTFVTAEPFLGSLGFGQTAASSQLQRLFAERDIASRVNVDIDRIRRCEVDLSTGETLPAHAAVIMPPFTGVVDIWKSAGLTDETGMIPVTDLYQHVEHRDIFAAGVASYFARPVPPLPEQRAPQTGYLAVHMGKAAGENVAASLDCGLNAQRPLPYLVDMRVIDGGSVGLLLTSRGNRVLSHNAIRLPGTAAHALKSSIERYLVWRLRTGRIDLP